jgi:hypothetical protein
LPANKRVESSVSVIADPNVTHVNLIREQELHHDLIDCLHPDHYSSLPFKLRYAYQWVTTHLPQLQWVVKVDDDTMVRVDTLEHAFLRTYNPQIPLVIGHIIEESAVARTGKWREETYQGSYYPFWPKGSCGHVVSRMVAQYIGCMPARSFHYYQGEDTSLGIWLDEASPATKKKQKVPDGSNNNHSQLPQLEPVTWIHSRYFANSGHCDEHDWLIMGHGISPEHMRACYQNDEWSLEEVANKDWNYWKVDSLEWIKDKQRGWSDYY